MHLIPILKNWLLEKLLHLKRNCLCDTIIKVLIINTIPYFKFIILLTYHKLTVFASLTDKKNPGSFHYRDSPIFILNFRLLFYREFIYRRGSQCLTWLQQSIRKFRMMW